MHHFSYLLRVVAACLVFGASVVLFPSYQVWSGNTHEVFVGYGTITTEFFGEAFRIVVLASIFLGLLLMPFRSVRQLFTALVLGLSVAFWIQANFLIWEYEEFSGSAIDFSGKLGIAMFEIVIWLLVIGMFIRWRHAAYQKLFAFAGLLLVIQIAPIAVAFLLGSEEFEDTGYSNDLSHTYTFSNRANTILLVLDAFQHDIFADVIEEGAYEDLMRGFVVYDNAVTPSRYTRYTFPALLTGLSYDGDLDFHEFLQSTVRQKNIVTVLESHGYRSTYITGPKDLCYNLDNCFNRYRLIGREQQILTETLELLNATVFRLVPHLLKPSVFDGRSGVAQTLLEKPKALPNMIGWNGISKNIDFFREFTAKAMVDDGPATFKFIHLANGHTPLSVNEECRYEEMPNTRRNFVRTNYCTLQILQEFKVRLTELGIWDKSLVLMLGDHGARGVDTGIQEVEPGIVLGDAWPMLVMKLPGADAPMTTSSAPVSLSDVPVTITEALGIEAEFPGVALHKNQHVNLARDYFYSRRGPLLDRTNERISFIHFTISGHPAELASWSK